MRVLWDESRGQYCDGVGEKEGPGGRLQNESLPNLIGKHLESHYCGN